VLEGGPAKLPADDAGEGDQQEFEREASGDAGRVLARQWGALTGLQARQAGLSQRQVKHRAAFEGRSGILR
jgi:hypothetical protein